VRLLFLTSFYPPHEIGGWEQLTQEIVDGLGARGHQVHVLTSRHGGTPPGEHRVERVLQLQNDQVRYRPLRFLWRHAAVEEATQAAVRACLARVRPDAVMVHTMWNLSRGAPWALEQALGDRVVYYMADYWAVEPDVNGRFWQGQLERPSPFRWRARLAGHALSRVTAERRRYRLRFPHIAFVSRALQQSLESRGLPRQGRRTVIYNGVDTRRFAPPAGEQEGEYVLFAGGLGPHKGVDTLLQAMALLGDPELRALPLVVAGGGHPADARRVAAEVSRLGLGDRVQLLGAVARERMPEVYRRARAFVLPSVWEEPLARALQEAMACGLPVVAAPTGGTRELLQPEVNGLSFPVEDAVELAGQLRRLLASPELGRALGQAARRTVVSRFEIGQTVQHVEAYLAEAVAAA
jgi:glycosyltransferase involved in cell wall biosynthesis